MLHWDLYNSFNLFLTGIRNFSSLSIFREVLGSCFLRTIKRILYWDLYNGFDIFLRNIHLFSSLEINFLGALWNFFENQKENVAL